MYRGAVRAFFLRLLWHLQKTPSEQTSSWFYINGKEVPPPGADVVIKWRKSLFAAVNRYLATSKSAV